MFSQLENCECYCICTGTAVSCLKSFVTCFMLHIISDVHCSVHNTIIILLTRFDASIPLSHCIVDSVFYGLKCELSYLKIAWNFGLPFTEWHTLYGNQHVSYTVPSQNNGAVSKVNKKFIYHLTQAQCTQSVAATGAGYCFLWSGVL
jgi:hypothetical protein